MFASNTFLFEIQTSNKINAVICVLIKRSFWIVKLSADYTLGRMMVAPTRSSRIIAKLIFMQTCWDNFILVKYTELRASVFASKLKKYFWEEVFEA